MYQKNYSINALKINCIEKRDHYRITVFDSFVMVFLKRRGLMNKRKKAIKVVIAILIAAVVFGYGGSIPVFMGIIMAKKKQAFLLFPLLSNN